MYAAIYARKSTEQRGFAADAESVTRQITHAKAFAATKGWKTDDRFVFEDDGISGTEFEKRAGLQALLALLNGNQPAQAWPGRGIRLLSASQSRQGDLHKSAAHRRR